MSVKKVAVLGGGFFGASTASALAGSPESDLKVTLFSDKDFAISLPSVSRAVTRGFDAKKVTVQLTEVLHKDVNLQLVKQIAKFDQKSVTFVPIDSDAPITEGFDYIVVTTGMKWGDPIDYAAIKGHDLAAFEAYTEEQYAKLEKAQKLVIVGGGFVGCELAGEICYTFKDKKKEIILVHPFPKLLHETHLDKVRAGALNHLKQQGVEVVLSDKAIFDDTTDTNTVKLASGRVITDVDLVYKTTGPSPSIPPNELDITTDDGYIEINEYMQSPKYDNIFAAGDVAKVAFRNLTLKDQIVKALVHNIEQLSKGNSSSTFEKAPATIFTDHDKAPISGISMGPDAAVGQFQIPLIGLISAPQFLLVRFKARKLHTDMLDELFGKPITN